LNYEALDLVTSQVKTSNLKRDRLRTQLRKLHKRGKLDFTQLDEEWRWRLCCARLRLGDYSDWDGWQFRSEWSKALDSEKTNLPKWDGRPYGSGVAKLLILGEEGIGDEIMHASVIPEAIVRLGKAGVIYECGPRIHGIIERSFGIECRPRQPLNVVRVNISHWIAQGELSSMFRKDVSHFPGKAYLKADPKRVEEMQEFVANLPRPLYGISWQGRHGFVEPHTLMKEPGTYINLQYDESAPEGVVEPPIDLKQDIEGVYALLTVLDKVLTVPTSVVHFAGSLGVPTDLYPVPRSGQQDIEYSLNWRVGPGKTHVWHNSVRILQPEL
jgi:hypothetical protein